MADGRIHVFAGLGDIDVHVIVSWPAGTPIADIEETIKTSARAAVTQARERHRD